MVNKKKSIVSVFLLVVLISISFISAFAVSSPSKIRLYRGDGVENVLTVQNIQGATNDLEVTATIQSGSEFVSFSGENKVIVPKGGVSNIKINIDAPLEAKFGVNTIVVKFDPTPVASDEPGTVQFVTAYTKSFEVEIIPRPEEVKEGLGVGWIILIILIIIAMIAIVIVLVRNKKSTVPKNTVAKPVVKPAVKPGVKK